MKVFRFSRETILLGGILALAFLLRVWGLGFGLPYLYHADEPIVVNHALAYGMGDLNPHFFKIPPLVSYLLFICYGIYCVAGCAAGLFHSVRDFEQLFYFDPSSFYWMARLIFGVLLGTVTVYVLYRLAKKVVDPGASLWAAFFLAVNFLHARDSHYIYADIPLLLSLLAGFLVLFRIVANPFSWKLHLVAGGMVGLAAATKYNGAFLAIPYLWVCLRCVPWRKWPIAFILAGAGAAIIFVALNPYAVIDPSFFMQELVSQSVANQGGFSWLHPLTYSLAGAMGWPMLIAALLGTVAALFGKEARRQAAAIFVAAYYAVLCRFGQPYDRYVLPLVPFMVIFAAHVFRGVERRSRLLFWVLIPFAVLPSFIALVHWDLLMSKPDVRTIAKNWIEAHIPAGSSLALDGTSFTPRLAFSPRQLEEKRLRAAEGPQSAAKVRRLDALLARPHRPFYELCFLNDGQRESGFLFAGPLAPFDLRALKEKGVQYVILIEAFRPRGDVFFRDLRDQADRIMTFSPYRDPGDLTIRDPYIMTGGPFLWKDILPRQRGGYPISIYKIRS